MKTVILGIGNRYRSDDAIGSLIAEEISSQSLDNIIVYDVGITPENFIDKVVLNKPDWLILVDACNFSAQPGEFRLFDENELEKVSYGLLSTHTLPITLTIVLIKKQHNCKISLLGIQPQNWEMGTELSPELKSVKEQIINFIKKLVL